LFTFISSLIIAYCLDIVLIGLAFQALVRRFSWRFSPGGRLLILFLVFALWESYYFPAVVVLDLTYTIENEAIAKAFDFSPNEPLIELFGLGWFELTTWSIQALLASWVGEKMLGAKATNAI